jgi:hypothetical protein
MSDRKILVSQFQPGDYRQNTILAIKSALLNCPESEVTKALITYAAIHMIERGATFDNVLDEITEGLFNLKEFLESPAGKQLKGITL